MKKKESEEFYGKSHKMQYKRWQIYLRTNNRVKY